MRSLYKMCASHSLLPGSLRIEVHYDPTDVAHSRGGFADVWKGEYRGLEVAVKALRTSTMSDLQKITRVSCQRCSQAQRIDNLDALMATCRGSVRSL